MFRAAEESFYTHAIPILLWDDVINFRNTNRSCLTLVNKRSRIAVTQFAFPEDWIRRQLDKAFPVEIVFTNNWQYRAADAITRGMILHNPRVWDIIAPRRSRKSHFALAFLNMVKRSSQYVKTYTRFRFHEPELYFIETTIPSIKGFEVTFFDDWVYNEDADTIRKIEGTVITTSSEDPIKSSDRSILLVCK
jgi:hypothetical protein